MPCDLKEKWCGNTEMYHNPQPCVSYSSGALTNHITALMKRPFKLGSHSRKARC